MWFHLWSFQMLFTFNSELRVCKKEEEGKVQIPQRVFEEVSRAMPRWYLSRMLCMCFWKFQQIERRNTTKKCWSFSTFILQPRFSLSSFLWTSCALWCHFDCQLLIYYIQSREGIWHTCEQWNASACLSRVVNFQLYFSSLSYPTRVLGHANDLRATKTNSSWRKKNAN